MLFAKYRKGEILKRYSFPKEKRLINSSQFKAVLSRNLRASDGLLTLFMAENDCSYRRLGISVGRSCGGAVVRNRLKRLLREVFRQNQEQIPTSFDYVLMISSQLLKKTGKSGDVRDIIIHLTFERLKASFLALVADAIEKNAQK